MSQLILPKVFIIGESKIDSVGLQQLLNHLSVPAWKSDADTDVEKLLEVYGRACYKSFDVILNPNLTRVRKHNDEYIKNIIEKGDGSVLEHGMINFFFADVSRVFTHELVRHRVGTAISQESLRFVRLTDLNWYAPICIQEDVQAMEIFSRTLNSLSQLQKDLADLYNIDNMSFEKKKELTSAFRRLAPDGLATNIGWSANIRTIRHVLEMRTNPSAEEEIRLVFSQVGKLMRERYKTLFDDYETEIVNGIDWYKTKHRKV
ncbi:FAD-dependent thymidylate synthase [Candidatus Daviesbacteria bacterium]|nr:FAD-dependent thymidylate synthase [Candidatus Daviesbacteria bacterium]